MNDLNQELGPVSEAVVIDSVRITPPERDEVRRIRLRIDDPAFRFSVGQSIGVVVPGPHPMGNKFHMRRYSIASGHLEGEDSAVELELLVRRCFYVDEVSGERFPGIASHYLCDAQTGKHITVTGPYRSPFRIPSDEHANLLMIGTGTGVAPFRSFVQEIYREKGGWKGKVRLFYGARNGMDLLYGNDAHDDLTNYLDHASFKAFGALITRPLASESDTLKATMNEHATEVWKLMQDPDTHVYLAGLGKVSETFDRIMEKETGGAGVWAKAKERMRSQGRWSELVYS